MYKKQTNWLHRHCKNKIWARSNFFTGNVNTDLKFQLELNFNYPSALAKIAKINALLKFQLLLL